MPIAKIVLLCFPLLAIWIFKRFTAPVAVAATVIFGYLLLPQNVGWDFPLLPPINKHFIPSFCALVLALVLLQPSYLNPNPDTGLKGWVPRTTSAQILITLIIAGAFLTVLTNGDAIRYGPRRIQGIGIYSAFSSTLSSFVILLPFFLGRKFLGTVQGQRTLLKVLAFAGACYALPVIYEIIMSPQLNRMIYGFFQSSWRQHVRGVGYRPIVFLEHGLWLAIFMASAGLAAFGLVQTSKGKERQKYWIMAALVLGSLMMSRSLGALVICIWALGTLIFMPRVIQLLSAAIIAGMVLSYPLLRGADLIPTQTAIELASRVSADRANSLDYRFTNEDILLEKAAERPLFGWGSFGRWRVYNDEGEDITTSDGYWIITIAKSGWVGYLTDFGFLCWPVILFGIMRRRLQVTDETAVLSVIMAAGLIDLIPNATDTPITMLIAGALYGRLEAQPETAQDEEATAPGDAGRRLSYARSDAGLMSARTADSAPRHTRQTKLHVRKSMDRS